MRIHRIELQAFGPFAGRESVDLEPLNEAGLFLLDGPTGAGKSTVLAAVCFALYGTVPGRRATESLASTHAVPGTRPEVLVEVTLGGRRFEILRWPKYQRPRLRRSKDGSLLTGEQSGAQLRELVEGQWREVSVRADEIGQLLRTVLPLDAEQFMHVVMLPQGEFARFLRADSTEKESLLRKLFGTDRFDQVETYLRDQHQRLADAVHHDLQLTERLRAEIDEALTDRLGADWDRAETQHDSDADQIEDPPQERSAWTDQDWDHHARSAVERGVAHARTNAESCQRETAQARLSLERMQDHRASITAAVTWTERQRQHRDLQAQTEEDRRRLERHRLAAPVVRRALEVDQAQAVVAVAQSAWTQALRAARQDPQVIDWAAAVDDRHGRGADQEGSGGSAGEEGPGALTEHLRRVLAQAERAIAAADQHAQDDRRAAQLDEQLGRDRALEKTLTDRTAQLATEITDLQDRAAVLQTRAADLGPLASARDQAGQAAVQAEERLTAARRAAELESAVQASEQDVRAATDHAQDSRQQWLDLVQRRLDNAAALLAAELIEGQPCAVCGSADHPAPAASVSSPAGADDRPPGGEPLDLTPAALEKAHEVWRAAESAREQAQRLAEDLRRQAAESHSAAQGQTVDEAQQRADAAREAQLSAERSAAELDGVQQQITQVAEAGQEKQEALTQARTEHVQLQSTIDHRGSELERLRQQISAALQGRESLSQLRADLQGSQAEVEAALRSGEALLLEQARAQSRQESLAAELTGSGYSDPGQARAAVLDEDVRTQMADSVQSWDHEGAALAELAQTPAVITGLKLVQESVACPDEPALADALETLRALEKAEQAAVAESGAMVSLQQHVDRQCRTLREVGARSAAQRAEATEVEELLKLVRGSGENEYRMRLASYVLAGRLEDVAQAATERLLTMTDGRYELIHDDSDTGGGRRRGLDLVVRDLYTDSIRSAASLSGGETFMASLALALGLADTVQAEAGGVEMDTLFVDEGFGSLDAQTLEQVMDVLDGLQAGGRTLGLVSHVDRMRQEISCRLEVTKTRQGSHLRVVLPDSLEDYAGHHAS